MRNKILHALANRTGPFREAIFGAQPEFVPAVFTDQLARLREKLYLHETGTDYYLTRYLSLLEAFPDLKSTLADESATYQVWELLPRGVQIEGGDLLSSNIAGLYIEPENNLLPINLNYTIDCVNAALAKITAVEHGLTRLAPALASGDASRPWLRITWPSDIPFHGPLRLDQPWTAGTKITIKVEPCRFPYETLVRRIQADDALNELLIRAELLNEFHGSSDPLEKLAVALTLVAAANPSVYGGISTA